MQVDVIPQIKNFITGAKINHKPKKNTSLRQKRIKTKQRETIQEIYKKD